MPNLTPDRWNSTKAVTGSTVGLVVHRGTARVARGDAARGTRSGPPWGEEPGAYFGRVVYWGVPVSQDDNLTLVLMDELMPLVSVVSTCIHFP